MTVSICLRNVLASMVLQAYPKPGRLDIMGCPRTRLIPDPNEAPL